MPSFALIGAGGYIAPRHMKAIKETGGTLLAAMDRHDSVGILDSYFPEAEFFTELERFERHLEKLKREGNGIDYMVVCSPNYLHDAHIRFGMKLGADVICEKPVVINPWNVDALMEMEKETGRRVYTIMQLRLHPQIMRLKKEIEKKENAHHQVNLTYITVRGSWYHSSWKGDSEKSGGIVINIGIHFFDILLWLFGEMKNSVVLDHSTEKTTGRLELERATVNWLLSTEMNMLPERLRSEGKRTFRSISVDNDITEFSEGFNDLHSLCYSEILNGRGFSLSEAKKSIELASVIRFQLNEFSLRQHERL